MASEAIVELVVDATNAERDVERQVRRIAENAEDSAPDIELNVDVDSSSVRDLRSELRDLASDSSDANRSSGDLGRTLSSLGSAAGGIGQVAGVVGGIGVAAGGAIPLVAGVVTALAEIAPAAAAGVTAVGALALGAATLQLGMMGVGEAIETAFDPDASPEEFQKALDRLSPSAAAFVKELSGMKKGFKELQLDVQENLFKDLDQTLKDVAQSAGPDLRRGLLETSKQFNIMARGVGDAVKELADNGTLGRAVDSATGSFESLNKLPAQFVKALGQIAAAGGPLLEKFADAVADVADSISGDLDSAFESGALEDTINAAGDSLQQLGRIARNIGSSLKNVFDATSVSGDGLFNTLEQITGILKDATASEGFQTALGELAKVAKTLGENLGTLLLDALKAIGPVFEELGPPVRRLLDTLGGSFSDIIKGLGPTLQSAADAVGKLVDAFSPFLGLVSELVVEFLPVLTAIFDELSASMERQAPLIQRIVDSLRENLVPVIQELTPLLIEQVEQFGQLAETALPAMAGALEIVLPLVELLLQGLTLVLQILGPVQDAVGAVSNRILSDLVTAFRDVINFGQQVHQRLTQLHQILSGVVMAAIGRVSSALNSQFVTALIRAGSQVVRTVNQAVNQFARLPGRVTVAIGSLSVVLVTEAAQATRQMVSAISSGISRAVSEVARFPGRALGALGNLGGLLFSSGRALIRGFADGIRSMVGAVRDAVSSVVSAAGKFFPHSPAEEGPFSGRGWTEFSGQALIDGFAEGIESQSDNLRRVLSQSLAIPDLSSGSLQRTGQELGVSQSASPLSVSGLSEALLSPTVYVSIGNREVDAHVSAIVERKQKRLDKLATQGTRF